MVNIWKYASIFRVLYIPVGAGFLPSTVRCWFPVYKFQKRILNAAFIGTILVDLPRPRMV